MSKSYFELLKDPRWQRRRLEILTRDDFKCTACDDRTSTLHVHHGFYVSGRAPWEYGDECLHTLCERCHENATTDAVALREALSRVHPALAPMATAFVESLTVQPSFVVPERPGASYSFTAGLAILWGLPPEAVRAAVVDGRVTRDAAIAAHNDAMSARGKNA